MKLIIADDHTLFRDALVQYIVRADPDVELKLAKDFPETVAFMDEDPDQDLVILDLRMPGMNGLDGFRAMSEKYPDTPTALMSGVAEVRDVEEAMSLGAAGYFPKTLSGKALLQAISSVLDGNIFVPRDSETGDLMPSYYEDGKKGMSGASHNGVSHHALEGMNLTPREMEVLGFLVQGSANKEIANALELQLVTVKLHVRGICRKLDAKNRTQAALKAQSLGFGN